MVPLDNATKSTVQSIPLLSVRAGPRDGDQWIARLKQELNSLIAYVNTNKAKDSDWFIVEPNKLGTKSDRHGRPTCEGDSLSPFQFQPRLLTRLFSSLCSAVPVASLCSCGFADGPANAGTFTR